MFRQLLEEQIKEKKSHLCVGLDSDYDKLPEIIKKNNSIKDALFLFNKEIVDATQDLVVAYKPNIVFYSGYGFEGLQALKDTNEYIKKTYPHIMLIAESKRTEILRTAELSIKELFDDFLFDSLNIMPWYGEDSINVFKSLQDKAVFVIGHDTNPSSIEIQDIKLETGMYMYEYVTHLVSQKWNTSGNIFIEAPLTFPDVMKRIKNQTDTSQFFLIVGLGAQGGSIKDLEIFKEDKNFIVSASRSVIFASVDQDFAEKAREQVLQYNKDIHNLI